MALVKRTADGKKRCLLLNSLGMQCTKVRKHPEREIDVVHQAGMFVWRSDGLATTRMELTNARVTLGGHNLTPFITPNSLVFTKPEKQGHRATRVIFDEAHRFQPGDRVTAEQMDPIDLVRKSAEGVFHSMCDPADPCSATCGITASPEQQLTEWWLQQAEDEVARTVPKAIEYSATDLTDIGHDLARTAGREVDDEEAAELGVFFYLRGKMARWVGAVMAGTRVSDDTLFDIGVYVRMAQRIREKGNWPGVENLDA